MKKKGEIIYIGKAKNLRNRVRSYFLSSQESLKTQHLIRQTDDIDFLLTPTETEAFLTEASLVKKHNPRYNIRLKDDKSYPYIRCSLKDEFPRFYLSRNAHHKGSFYFGPFSKAQDVRETLRFLNKTFQVRDCKDHFMKTRKRPCITYQMEKCTAPCVDFVSKKDYSDQIHQAISFLKGEKKELLKHLKKKMLEAAKKDEFEKAHKIKKKKESIESILERKVPKAKKNQDVVALFQDEKQAVFQILNIRFGSPIGSRTYPITHLHLKHTRCLFSSFFNQYYLEHMIPEEILLSEKLNPEDSISLEKFLSKKKEEKVRLTFPERGEKRKLVKKTLEEARESFLKLGGRQETTKKALEEIKRKFHMKELPHRIECFDVSHLSGSQTAASSVVFENGEPKKSDYRRYKIRSHDKNDDYKSLEEVFRRRFKKEDPLPDLIVVDGGKGQLNRALSILQEMKKDEIPIVGIAKSRTESDFESSKVHKKAERFFLPRRKNPVLFSFLSPGQKILTSLRDEAHRFAISYHRLLRKKNLLPPKKD